MGNLENRVFFHPIGESGFSSKIGAIPPKSGWLYSLASTSSWFTMILATRTGCLKACKLQSKPLKELLFIFSTVGMHKNLELLAFLLKHLILRSSISSLVNVVKPFLTPTPWYRYITTEGRRYPDIISKSFCQENTRHNNALVNKISGIFSDSAIPEVRLKAYRPSQKN